MAQPAGPIIGPDPCANEAEQAPPKGLSMSDTPHSHFFPESAPWIPPKGVVLPVVLARPFDGYPYLVSRIGQWALCHMAVVPADWPRARLLHLVRRQAEINRLETYLCLGPSESLRAGLDGSLRTADFIPTGLPVPERLVLVDSPAGSTDLARRRFALHTYAKRLSAGSGYTVGDGLEGGRVATPAEVHRHREAPAGGIPAGLTRCGRCKALAGEYLALEGEGNGDMTPRVVQVHCQCENHNRCAGCDKPLAARRLSSYAYDEVKRSVTYYAAYMAFGHKCN